jgi:AcrR family transcriptional regulator
VPRVSEAHLIARREQILDAAQRRFLRNGFHATSMQDVLTEAGLSAGAVYRYFRSKDEIIAAIADRYSGELIAALVDAIDDPDRSLIEVMSEATTVVDENAGPDGILRLAVQVWAESLRDETIAPTVQRVFGNVRARFVQLAARAVSTGELPSGTDTEATGAALFALVLGYAVQRVLTGTPDLASYRRGLRTLLDR